jgi:uncharacterized protein YecE (DUF72 family)
MDFGKLPSVDHVAFRLPEPDAEERERNLRVLKAAGTPIAPPVLRVGATAWAHKQWISKVYPLGAKPADFLRLYSRQFNAIELNTTHYRIPTPEAVMAWRDDTPAGFKFCPKFPQEISHHRELVGCEPLTAMFCDSLARLGDRLGTSFLQLPPGFGPQRLHLLERFLRTVPRGFPVTVELRHPQWFDRGQLIGEAREVLERAGAGTAITDTAGRREVLHASLTAPRTLIRFVGNELHPSDYSRIDAWIARLREWASQGLREIYFIVHQPEDTLSPELISYFIERSNAAGLPRLEDWTREDRGTQMAMF